MSTNATKKGQYMPAHPCRQSRIIRTRVRIPFGTRQEFWAILMTQQTTTLLAPASDVP
jgi:hypothetical protein